MLILTEALGLIKARHRGPSTIGIDTIYRSKGKVPEPFLRGCGVPENFITFAKSLVGSALEFYSVFISYSTKDQPFADRLHADLQARGVRCWFAPHDIQGGRKLHEQIDEAIRVYDKLLLILSDASMTSDWVAEEIARARKRERRENWRMLFPISIVPYDAVRDWECFDADAGKDSAREVREYVVPDFSNSKNSDVYHRAFDRLVRDLKAAPNDRADAQSPP
jgi:TIR domain